MQSDLGLLTDGLSWTQKHASFDVESVSDFQRNYWHRLMPLEGGGTRNRNGEIITEIGRESIREGMRTVSYTHLTLPTMAVV